MCGFHPRFYWIVIHNVCNCQWDTAWVKREVGLFFREKKKIGTVWVLLVINRSLNAVFVFSVPGFISSPHSCLYSWGGRSADNRVPPEFCPRSWCKGRRWKWGIWSRRGKFLFHLIFFHLLKFRLEDRSRELSFLPSCREVFAFYWTSF